ncbi:MAG: type II secretion system protein GspG [Candidatus Omnitrophica bacterium]|nr:type II secretion system protein GspG [Candidatus Omnitrophota bacterium]MBU4333496.1 type II secretion system protein GspG [Candidatus Omnitrophota bacterium]
MKKVPLTITIPCVLDIVISVLFIVISLVMYALGASPSWIEKGLLVLASINGVAAYKCMKRNLIAGYIVVGLKGLTVFVMPATIVIGLLWGYLLIRHSFSKGFFSEPEVVVTFEKKSWLKAIVAGIVMLILIFISAYFHSQNNPNNKMLQKIDITRSNMDMVNSFIDNYFKENHKLPIAQSEIKELNGPNKHMASFDAWGYDIVYVYDEKNDSYQLISMGEDGVESEDDIVMEIK